MTDELLNNIIQLEKVIQAEVAEEQARATAWQIRELSALQEALAAARKEEELHCRQLLAEKKSSLLREGAAIEEAVAAWCERLTSLEEAILQDVLKRHLVIILPGGEHDHPHGQG
jgi:hypothetical protein